MKPKYQLNSLINAYIEDCNALVNGQITGIAVTYDTYGKYIFNYRVSFDNTFEFVVIVWLIVFHVFPLLIQICE